MDVTCAKCGEPYELFYVNEEMLPIHRQRFKEGKGCECCRWGTICPDCIGTGHEIDYRSCDCCHGRGFVYCWSPYETSGRFTQGHWYSGYDPQVRRLGANPPGFKPDHDPTYPGERVRHGTADCPEDDCPAKESPPCPRCNGSGKLTPDEDLELEAAKSECDASDEDPMLILKRRKLI